MGCGNAKQIQVAPASEGGNAVQNKTVAGLMENGTPIKTSSCPNTPSLQKKLGKDLQRNPWTGSQESLVVDRHGSATSKISKHSCDSGLGGDPDENPSWIDENSDPDRVQSIMEGWKSPRDLGKFISYNRI